MRLPSLLRLCCCVLALAGFLAGAAAVQQAAAC